MIFIFATIFCLGAILTFGFIQISKQDKQISIQEQVKNNVSFVEIDNCQYIVSNFGPLVLTHKGNCANCLRKQKI
jgi:hypothetical protein